MTIIRFAFAILLVLSMSFAQTTNDAEEIRKSILAVMQRQVDGWNGGSIEKFMDGYERSDSLRFASGGTVTYGWRTMLERYQKRYSTPETMGTLEFSDMTVTVLSPTAAVVFGRWKLQRFDDAPAGLFTLLFRKTDRGWRIVHDHTSSAEEKK